MQYIKDTYYDDDGTKLYGILSEYIDKEISDSRKIIKQQFLELYVGKEE